MASDPGASPRRKVAAGMAEAAAAWLDVLDAPSSAGSRPAPSLPTTATDAERRRWFYTPTDHGGLTFHEQRPAQQRAAMRLVATGPVRRRLRHGRDRHGPGERAGPHGGLPGAVRPGARPRPRPVLPAGLRRARRRGAVGLAVRRPPRLAQQPGRRRRAGQHHAVLPGGRPGHVAAARRRGEPPARPGRGPGA